MSCKKCEGEIPRIFVCKKLKHSWSFRIFNFFSLKKLFYVKCLI